MGNPYAEWRFTKGASVRHLSYAQLIMANHSLSELKAQSLLLDEAIAKAKSPIAQAKIHVPRLS